MIIEIGTDYTIAPLALRERLALGGETSARVLQHLVETPEISEAVVLSTCNRVEVYLATENPDAAPWQVQRALEAALAEPMPGLADLLIVRTEQDAVKHLCAVASGLQSMIVAEGQILGQVRDAFDQARHLAAAGPQLNAVFRTAVACGKRVRAETALGRTDISVSSVLIDIVAREISDWAAQRVLLIGAGRMIQITAERLEALGAGDLAVTSRTAAAAQRLAQSVGGRAITMTQLAEEACQATLIISATRSPGLMLTAEMLAGRTSSALLAVDLAVPRDLDPGIATLPGARLLDIDHLRNLQDHQGLAEALALAERFVTEAGAEWLADRRTRAAVPIIADLRAHVDRQRDLELQRTLARLDHLDPGERDEVSEMAHRLVNKMFHHLAIRMKKAAADPVMGEQYLRAARYLFDHDESDAPRATREYRTARAELELSAEASGADPR